MVKTKFRAHSFRRWLAGASLPRYGYDGIAPDAEGIARLFPHASFVCGYDTGGWPWTAQDWALFPHATRVHIATEAGYNTGDVLDVENGDAQPYQTAAWIAMRKASGYHRPTIYCSAAAVPAVRAGTGRYILNADYDLWVAHWTGAPHQEFSGGKGCAVTQYKSTNVADYNVCYDPQWPHRTAPKPVIVPPKPKPKPPTPVPVPVPPKPVPGPISLTRHVATGSVSLRMASNYYNVSELDILVATLANCDEAEQEAVEAYLHAATQGQFKPDYKMPKGLVYWVPAHTGKH
jgi:hypothetical protein